MTLGIVLAGGVVLGALVSWIVGRRLGRREEAWTRLTEALRRLEVSALPDGRTWEFEGRRFELWIDPPSLFADNLYVRLSLFTPRLLEFSVKRAEGIEAPVFETFRQDPLYGKFDIQTPYPREVRDYLDSARVRALIEGAVCGRWRLVEQRALRLSLEDNIVHDRNLSGAELAVALKTLRALDEGAPDPRPSGGVFTYRFGFEPDVPPWHWPVDELRKLPRAVKRFVVSYYRDDPLLNLGLVDLLLDLCGKSRACFLTDQEDLGFLDQAFGPSGRERRKAVVETRSPATVVGADRFTEGVFFRGLAAVPAGASTEPFETGRRHEFHEIAVSRLGELDFWARRLLDDEAAWYSGEIEILTLHLDEARVREAVDRTAKACQAEVMEIDRRFTPKIFRDEKFEYSA